MKVTNVNVIIINDHYFAEKRAMNNNDKTAINYHAK